MENMIFSFTKISGVFGCEQRKNQKMNKEKQKNDKVKKKKSIKKESTEEELKETQTDTENNCAYEAEIIKSETNEEICKPETETRNSNASAEEKGNESNVSESSKKRVRNIPDGFYIAHPRSIKKATNCFQDVHSRKLAELLEAFHMFDFDRDGIINRDDLKKTFQSLNWNDVKDEDADQMLLEGLNPLNFDAFVILLGYKTLDLDPEEVFLDALSTWDEHHDGLISHERLLHDIVALGDKFTEEEAIAALADAPIVFTRTKEKMIDYIQFSEDLCGLRKMMQRKNINKTE